MQPCVSPVATGEISTWGTMLSAVCGASTLNPTNMINNCVSVSLAKLLDYKDVHELWNDIYGRPLPDNPMSTDQIVDLVQRTGWSFRWENYRIYPHLSVNECLRGAMEVGNHHGCAKAVLYARPDSTGHCVVLDILQPLCYQHDSDGEDVEEDIKANAEMVSLLRLKCPPETAMHRAWLDRKFRRIMEKRAAERSWTLEYQHYMSIHKSRRIETFDEFCKTLADLYTGDESQTEYKGKPESSSQRSSIQMCQYSEKEDKQRCNGTIRAKL